MMNHRGWQMKQEDVDWAWGGSSSGRRKAGTSRANSITSAQLTLTHKPTGLSVKGEIQEGRYSKTQMQDKKRDLYEKLFDELEVLVAKKLGKG